jgi:hypothetical protein
VFVFAPAVFVDVSPVAGDVTLQQLSGAASNYVQEILIKFVKTAGCGLIVPLNVCCA